MSDALPLGSRIGILGGGQLGRMLSVAAARLGFKTHIYDPNPHSPAFHVADQTTSASYEDRSALDAFLKTVDVITYEFENIPTSALDILERASKVLPNRRALEVSQDRLFEKNFIKDLSLYTAEFWDITDAPDLDRARKEFPGKAILKTRRFGYDGKGQIKIESGGDLAHHWEALGRVPAILEEFVAFEKEISVIVARGGTGAVAAFDPGENEHREGILRRTRAPASVSPKIKTDAILAGAKIAQALDYVGVLGVEFFVTSSGLIVNEIAPRVHNSGHWTQNGCLVDQFEQHIRAIAGWPLGDAKRYADVEMINLIGDEGEALDELLKNPSIALHLYGKGEARPGRKMGHYNRVISHA